MSRAQALSIEVAEEFCEAQEPLRTKLQSQAWKSHGGHASSDTLSDEELLASAWAELPSEKRWTPVVWSAKTGRWSVCREQQSTVRWVSLDEPKMVAQYKSGWSLHRVGIEHGCSAETVRYVLGRRNVPTRSLSEALRGDNAFGRRDVRLDEAVVTDLRIRRWVHGETWDALAECYGISYTAARSAGVGLSWSHVPMPEACLQGMRRRAEQKAAAKAAEVARPEPKPFDIELAKRLYVVERKSLKRAAKALGVSDNTLQRELRAHGVRIRGKSEAADVVWSSNGLRRMREVQSA